MRRTSDPHSSSSNFPWKTFQIRKDLQDFYQYQVQYTLENISETLYQAFSAVQFTLIPQTFQISTYQKPENCSNKIVFEIQGIEQTRHPSVIISASKEPSKRLFTKKKKKKKYNRLPIALESMEWSLFYFYFIQTHTTIHITHSLTEQRIKLYCKLVEGGVKLKIKIKLNFVNTI